MPTTAGIRDASRRSLARLPMVWFFFFDKALIVSLLVGVCDWVKRCKGAFYSVHTIPFLPLPYVFHLAHVKTWAWA